MCVCVVWVGVWCGCVCSILRPPSDYYFRNMAETTFLLKKKGGRGKEIHNDILGLCHYIFVNV